MRLGSQIIIFVFAILTVVVDAHAQSPREQLSQMIEQLQKTPTDNALREQIIKLAQKLKPAPAVPEDARRAFVRGNTTMSDAKGSEDYARAVQLYRESSALAPWWGDPYFNLSKAHELQEDFNAAIAALKLFVLSAPPAEEARKAQDYVYVLEERRERKTRADDTKRQEQTRQEERQRWPRAVLDWIQSRYSTPLKSVEVCSVRVPRQNFCNDDDARGPNWTRGDGTDSNWPAGRNARINFTLTGCKSGELSFYWSFPEFSPTRFCGVVGGPGIADVKWTHTFGDRPAEIRFFESPKMMSVTYECDPERRCSRINWIFE